MFNDVKNGRTPDWSKTQAAGVTNAGSTGADVCFSVAHRRQQPLEFVIKPVSTQ
jgi:hypothetical protein